MLLLVLFGTLLSHSIFPHVHHTHEDDSVVENHHHHHDGESHHHSEKDNKSEEKASNLIDFLFGHHTHSNFNSDYTTEVVRCNQKKIGSKELLSLIANNSQQFLVFCSKGKETPLFYGDFQPENPFLLNWSLRGPPRLG